MWSGGCIDRITKYFYECITKIKIKKSKEDSRKLKELELALSKTEEEREIAYSKYSKLRDKTIRILDSITKIENKYSYTRRIKVLNPNYAGNQYD